MTENDRRFSGGSDEICTKDSSQGQQQFGSQFYRYFPGNCTKKSPFKPDLKGD